MPNGGPPDHWVNFPVVGMTGDQVLAKLNDLASQGYNSVAVSVDCTDGAYVFVGGYKK